MRNKTQADMVLDYFVDGGDLTSLEALQMFGIISFPKRICELERRGVKIDWRWVTICGKYGERKRVKRYSLKKETVD